MSNSNSSKWPPKPGNANAQSSVPIGLLREAEGMKVTVELKNGEIYRGLLINAENTMNMELTDVVRTARNGQVSKLPDAYLNGSSVRFVALPDLLQHAPMLQRIKHWRKNGGALKAGRAVIILRDAAERRSESKRRFRARKKSTQKKLCELSVSSPSTETPTKNEDKDWVMVSKDVPNSLSANKADDSCIIN